MVNKYMPAEEAERRSRYASNPTSAGYGGSGNYSRQLQEMDRRRNAQRQREIDAQRASRNAGSGAVSSQQAQPDYAVQAQQEVQTRPGYRGDLGDVRTQQIVGALEAQRVMFGVSGAELPSRDVLTGAVLESQRKAAETTPGTRDDQFFTGELAQWGQNKVEVGSAYHYVGEKAGVPIPDNPFELQADLAVEFLKGTPDKRSEYFSPASGIMGKYLPGGKGVQETSWEVARTGKPQIVSYMDAVGVLGTTSGSLRTGTVGKPFSPVVTTQPTQTQVAGRTKVSQPSWMPSGVAFTGSMEPMPKVVARENLSGKVFGMYVPVVSEGLAFFQPGSMTYEKAESTKIPESTRLVRQEFNPTSNGLETTNFYETTGGTVKTKTTVKEPTSSAYDIWQGGLSRQAYTSWGRLIGQSGEQLKKNLSISSEIQTAMTNRSPTPMNVATNIGIANIRETLEKPAEAGVFAGIGLGAGMAFRAADVGVGVGRAAIAEKVISQGGVWRAAEIVSTGAMKWAPRVMGGIYAVDVADRSTGGFTKFGAGDVSAKGSTILIHETVPMMAGGYVGYHAPGSIYNAARLSDIGYKSALQEGFTTGRMDYYVKQPVTKPIELAKIDYAAFQQENAGGFGDYLSGKVENAYRSKIDIPIKSFLQEGFRSPKGTVGIQPDMPGEIPAFDSGTPSGRIGTKTVGGKKVSGLSREPSLKSMGITGSAKEPSSRGTSGSIGQRFDYRGTQSPTMKPMNPGSYKQAVGQSLIFSEELAPVEGMTQGKVSMPARVQSQFGISVVRPELEFSTKSMTRQSATAQENPIFSISLSEMMGQRRGIQSEIMKQSVSRAARTQQFEQTARKQSGNTFESALVSISKVTSGVGQKSTIKQTPRITTITGIGQIQSPIRIPATTTKTTPITIPKVTTRQIPWTDITTPVKITTPLSPVIPLLGGGSGGGGYKNQKRYYPFRENVPIRLPRSQAIGLFTGTFSGKRSRPTRIMDIAGIRIKPRGKRL